ncbi:CoxL Aerobic-type carbon monoxide dehydrogenase, large subunit CoxL/CutL homologs [Burkholderiaceae bacterium]
MSAHHTLSRRSFVLSSGGMALGLSFGLTQTELALAQSQSATNANFAPNSWINIAADGKVTLMSPGAEMGQGTMTAMPMLLAEEMDLDWAQVTVVQAPSNPKLYGNPRFGGGMTTGASRTVQGYYEPLRLAGAQARLVIVQAAAQSMGVPASELRTEASRVIHTSGRAMTYAEVARVAQAPAELPKVDKSMLKPMSQFRLIGKDIPRVDVPAKSSGQAQYGMDQRLPGMLWASVLRAPVQGETPDSVDDAAARAIPGVKNVLRLPYGVAVVADSFFTAKNARDKLKVVWSQKSKARVQYSDQMRVEYTKRAQDLNDKGVDFLKHGDVGQKLAGAAKTFSATFTTEIVSHICLEPMNCTARAEGDTIEVWVPSQSASFVIGAVSGAAGFKPENIKVNITLMGGGFGRRVEADYAADAALVAKAMPGTPIQVIWTREDDMTHDKYRPMTSQHLVAGVDANGKMVGLLHRVVSEGIYARVAPPLFKASGGKDSPVLEGAEITYDIADHNVQFMIEERGIQAGFWRAVGPGYTKFAIESLIDEVARGVGADPLAYRMDMLGKNPRGQAVLKAVGDMAQWGKAKLPKGHALGLAFSDAWNTYCGMVVQVSLVDGRPLVHKVWTAVDCGHALQPRNVQAQMEGSIIFGLSAALHERMDFRAGEPVQTNLNRYTVLRAHETPEVWVKVVPTDNHPGGVGEVGLPPVAPAISNALATLTGKRLRALPLPVI